MHPSRPAEQHDVPGVSPSPFRAAIGRARIEALTATAGGPQAGGAERRFEYRLLKRAGKRAAEEARWNALGRDGWELVGVTGKHAAFKRPA